MGDREELQELRRLEELEAKASKTADPGIGNVMINAVPKGVAGLLDLPFHAWNAAKSVAGAVHPQIKDYIKPTPSYFTEGAEKLGLIDPAKNPQTPTQRIVDTGIQTGIGALAGPGGMVRNAATGLTAGLAGQTMMEGTKSPTASLVAALAAPFALRSYSRGPALNPVVADTVKRGREAGFVVPPTEINPSFFNEKLESLAGKAAVGQEANLRNTKVADVLANRYLGVPDSTALTPESLGKIRQMEGKTYQELGQLRPTPQTEYFRRYHETDLVDQMNQARSNARDSWKAYNRSGGDGSLRDKAKAYEEEAASIERDIERLAKDNNREDLIEALAKSRQRIAKSHDVEAALNVGDAGISPPHVGRMVDAGKPITGELELIGKYQQAFPRFMREGAVVPSPGVSGTDAMMAALLGTTGAGAADSPYGAALGLLPLVRGGARAAALSNWNQNRLLKSAISPEGLGDTSLRSLLIANALAGGSQ